MIRLGPFCRKGPFGKRWVKTRQGLEAFVTASRWAQVTTNIQWRSIHGTHLVGSQIPDPDGQLSWWGVREVFPLETEGDGYVQLHLLTQQCSDSQLCLTLCNPMDCSLPGSSVHGILQVRILELVAIAFSRGSSRPRDRIHISYLLHWQLDSLSLVPPGKPTKVLRNNLLY